MKSRLCIGVLIPLGFAAVLSLGCSGGTSVPLAEAPPVTETPPQPVPTDVKQGGGSSSSGNMNRNPGASS